MHSTSPDMKKHMSGGSGRTDKRNSASMEN
jgi:hypothetical protein